MTYALCGAHTASKPTNTAFIAQDGLSWPLNNQRVFFSFPCCTVLTEQATTSFVNNNTHNNARTSNPHSHRIAAPNPSVSFFEKLLSSTRTKLITLLTSTTKT